MHNLVTILHSGSLYGKDCHDAFSTVEYIDTYSKYTFQKCPCIERVTAVLLACSSVFVVVALMHYFLQRCVLASATAERVRVCTTLKTHLLPIATVDV
jgi:hypothetical protein